MAVTGERIPICVLAHHPLVRLYLHAILDGGHEFKVTEADDPTEKAKSLGQSPLVFVIDSGTLRAPLEGYLYSVRTVFPHSKILILGTPLSDEELCRLLFFGIHGFIPYNQVEKSLLNGIRTMWRGHLAIPHQVLEQFAQYASHLSDLRHGKEQTFSLRQREIIELLHRRLSNKEIASILHISERTVRFHLENIFCKIGVHDRYSVIELTKSRMPNQP